MGTYLSNQYSQKHLDSAKISTTDAIKTASNRAIQKTAEATGDLIGSKIADKITSLSKMSDANIEAKDVNVQKKDTYLQKKDKNLLMN